MVAAIINNIHIGQHHEKIVYSKLLRYREEQLEHYEGPPLEASISDHHHVNPPRKTERLSSTRPSTRHLPSQSRQSQYSLADYHLQTLGRRENHAPQRHVSTAETEKTAESYDPFRPSRPKVADMQADHARITVLRQVSQTAGRRPSTSGLARPHKHKPRLTLTHGEEDVYSIASSPPTMHSAGASQLQRLMANQRRMSRGNSKVTVSSNRTGRSGSSQIVAHRRASHKRDVSFQWSSKRPLSSGQPHLRSREHQRNSRTLQERYSRDKARDECQNSSSPPRDIPRETPMPDAQPFIRSKKEGGRAAERRSTSKLPRDEIWTDDVRKVSTELDKLCDNAFNRISISSSVPTAITPGSGNRESQARHLSSATSFSIYEDPSSEADERHVRIKMIDASTQACPQRPLPPPPTMDPLAEEHLGSYTQRELVKTRELLKKRNRASYMEPGYLDDVIAHLDRLMQPSTTRLADEERRAVTDPTSSIGFSRKDTFEQIIENGNIGFRSASEPTKVADKQRKHRGRSQTIRVVEDTGDGYKPISPIKPLTIRKKSGASSHTPSPTTPTMPGCPPDSFQALAMRGHDSHSAGVGCGDRLLQPIRETDGMDVNPFIHGTDSQGESRKRSWFRTRHQPKPSRDVAPAPAPPRLSAKDVEQIYHCGLPQNKKRVSGTSNESQTSEPKRGSKGGRFLKIFTAKKGSRDTSGPFRGGGIYDLDDGASCNTEGSSMQLHSRDLQPGHPTVNSPQRLQRKFKDPRPQHGNDGRIRAQSKDLEDRHPQRLHDHSQRRSPPHPSTLTKVTTTRTAHTTAATTRPIQQRAHNWLARFLGIKPAVHVLCFRVGKLRARREVVAIFREWRRFGMRDVVVDKEAGRVWARVDRDNCEYCSLFVRIFESSVPLLVVFFFHQISCRGNPLTRISFFTTSSTYPAPLPCRRNPHAPSPWPSRQPRHCTVYTGKGGEE